MQMFWPVWSAAPARVSSVSAALAWHSLEELASAALVGK